MENLKSKKRVNFKTITLGSIIGLLIMSTTFFAYLYLTQEIPEVDTEVPQEQQEDTPIVQRDNPPPIFVLTQKHSDEAPCQPTTFDPNKDTYTLEEQSGTPSKLYKIDGFDGGQMMINGWIEEGGEEIKLPSPYSTTVYHFGCASSFSYVIEIKKNNVRQSLFTHVYDYSFSDDGAHLYLRNSQLEGDNWLIKSRIVDISSNKETVLPEVDCLNKGSVWESDRLLTHSIDDAYSYYQTHMCVWTSNAELLSRIDLGIAVGATSTSFIAEQYGLLPNDPDTMYVYTTREDNTCSLFLANIYGIEEMNHLDIYEKQEDDYYCAFPKVEFDLTNTNIDNGDVKYRIEKYDSLGKSLGYGDWNTKSI